MTDPTAAATTKATTAPFLNGHRVQFAAAASAAAVEVAAAAAVAAPCESHIVCFCFELSFRLHFIVLRSTREREAKLTAARL